MNPAIKIIGGGSSQHVEGTIGPTLGRTSDLQALRGHRLGDTASSISNLVASIAKEDQSLEVRLFEALAKAKILTSRVAMHLSQEWRSKLFRHLDSLHSLENWEEEDAPVREDSFRSFLRGILFLKPEIMPGLGLSNDGKVVATWISDSDRLTLEFGPQDRVRWVLSYSLDGERERAAGDTAATRLSVVLAPYTPSRWLKA